MKNDNSLEMTQQQIIQQEKLASIGQLAAGVAHEIIVGEHNGQLYAESKPMVGTKFIIILPIEKNV